MNALALNDMGSVMQRIDGFYLYNGGHSLRPLSDLKNSTKYSDAQVPLYIAQSWLEPVIMGRSVFRLKTSWVKGNDLLKAIKDAIAEIEPALGSSPQDDKELGWWPAYSITSALTSFETVLAAEWALSDLYLVSKFPGYDMTELIESGIVLFPSDLPVKAPETISDANQFGRCIAFRLPSAAAFHLHRINEAVLKRYYDTVTGGARKPKTRTIGAYIKEFERLGKGDPKVLAALDSLRSLHRNPLMHPEDILESVEEALSLFGAVQSVMVHMLKVIPIPQATPPAPIGAAAALLTALPTAP